MNQTSPAMTLFKHLWRFMRYALLALMILIVLYAVARVVHVSLGSFYTGSRGPYLQMPSDTAVTVRWQSAEVHIGRVQYGTVANQLDQETSEQVATDKHEVRLSGLLPLTRYFYRVGSHDQGDSKLESFMTSASAGLDTSVRFWVTGDQGYRGPIQTDVKNAAWQWLEKNARDGRGAIDFWLTTGDNAYRSGTNDEFQENFFKPYSDVLSRYPVWPAYGNHDARRHAFFDIFSLPTNAESGGTASHTEHYYSFDYGRVHVVMLDTQSNSLAVDGDMAVWLQADLKASNQDWKIVVMHHPAYTKGSHDSDRFDDSHGRLFDVRENILPILERHGVDLVLTGHSHMYERSHAMTCHYGESSEWKKEFIRDVTSPYTKGSGTVYMVVGSSSKLDNGPLDHPAMPVSLHQSGSVVININGDTLTSRFINREGKIGDQFTILNDSQQIKRSTHCE